MRFPRDQFLQHLSRFASASPNGLEALVLRHGVFMAPLPASGGELTFEDAQFPALTAWRLSSTKAAQRRGLAYAEGYASVQGIPVPRAHAWCVDPAGVVVDPSWAHGEHYFGFVLNRSWAERFLPSLYSGLMGRHGESPLLREPAETWIASGPRPSLAEGVA